MINDVLLVCSRWKQIYFLCEINFMIIFSSRRCSFVLHVVAEFKKITETKNKSEIIKKKKKLKMANSLFFGILGNKIREELPMEDENMRRGRLIWTLELAGAQETDFNNPIEYPPFVMRAVKVHIKKILFVIHKTHKKKIEQMIQKVE